MSNTVFQLKHSVIGGNTPSTLANGEIAINTYDGKLFYSKPDGSIHSIVTDTGPSGLNTEIQFNDSGVLGASANLSFNKTTNTLSVPVLDVNNAVVRSNSFTTSSLSQVIVDSWSSSTYRSAKYYVQITSGSSYQMIELSLIHNGTTVYLAQYGDVRTGSSLGIFDAEIDSGTLKILFTPDNSTTTIKSYSVLMKT